MYNAVKQQAVKQQDGLLYGRGDRVYQPEAIALQHFGLQNDIVAALYEVEKGIVRLDDKIKHSPYASSIKKTLIRGDGLGILNMDKVYPDIYSVMRLEAAGYLVEPHLDTNETLKSALKNEDHPTLDFALETYRFTQTLEWVVNPHSTVRLTKPGDLLIMYDRCMHGPTQKLSQAAFEDEDFEKTYLMDGAARSTQSAKLPYELLHDFCEFVSADTLTPLAQASIAQFQFEALKPFKKHMERMERLAMHHILHRRDLIGNIVVPINLFSAHAKDRPDDLLTPYREQAEKSSASIMGHVEPHVLNTAKSVEELHHFIISLHKTLSALIEQWKKRIGRLEKGSAAEQLLYHLAGTPIMTISQGHELIGKSVSATSEAFERLEQKGILREGKPIRRNKTYEAMSAILLHDSMYQRKAVTVREWLSTHF